MPPVVNYERPYQTVRFILLDLHGTDDRTNVRSLNEALYVLVVGVIGQRNAAVQEELLDVVQPELGSKDPARLGRAERFGNKDSSNQLRNMPKNDFHAQDGAVSLIRGHLDFRVFHAFSKSPSGENTNKGDRGVEDVHSNSSATGTPLAFARNLRRSVITHLLNEVAEPWDHAEG